MTTTSPPAPLAASHNVATLKRRTLLYLAAPAASLSLFFSSQGSGGPTLCPYRLCSGHACPGCGLTRSIAAGLRGDLVLSWRFHPLGLLVAAQLLLVWVVLATGWKRAFFSKTLPAVLSANAVLLIGTWALRWRLGLLEFVLAN